MIGYPSMLTPVATEEVLLPVGGRMSIPKARPRFERWTGEPPEDTYGNKPIVDVDGEPMFAELAILRYFQTDGWDGVWVDTFRKKHRTSWGDEGVVRLSGERLQLLKTINGKAGSTSGCFDVYCWKEDSLVFAESKRASKDSIRDTQIRWLEAALRSGLDPSSFLVVEWSFSDSPHPAAREKINLVGGPENAWPGVLGTPKRGVEGSASGTSPYEEPKIFYDSYDTEAHTKFIRWIERNQSRYVISCKSANEAKLHHAYCRHFKHGDKSASLTDNMKICSSSRRALERWASEHQSVSPIPCKSCM